MHSIKEKSIKILRKSRLVKFIYRIYQPIFIGNKSPLKNRFKLFRNFLNERNQYKKIEQNKNFEMNLLDSFPCIYDRTATTEIDPVYFYQDAWCAKKIAENKPTQHVDVASKVEMVSIISQFVPTTMVDIRPITLELPGLSFKKGSVIELPFKDNSVESLSSICVIEHIGLGRYGDEIDQFGTEKAMYEFKRVIAPNGNLYISAPIDKENKIYFNAHRAFTRDYLLKMAKPLKLIEEKYIYGKELTEKYKKNRGFGTGLFYFKKI